MAERAERREIERASLTHRPREEATTVERSELRQKETAVGYQWVPPIVIPAHTVPAKPEKQVPERHRKGYWRKMPDKKGKGK
jgi:hypothetical protein